MNALPAQGDGEAIEPVGYGRAVDPELDGEFMHVAAGPVASSQALALVECEPFGTIRAGLVYLS